jgi:CheY-like chemotaxis protein
MPAISTLRVDSSMTNNTMNLCSPLPEMDGFEATSQHPREGKGYGKRMPIIATTAHAMAGDRDK